MSACPALEFLSVDSDLLDNIQVYFSDMVNTCDTGARNQSFAVFDFFVESYSTLHLFQNTLYRIKISRF